MPRYEVLQNLIDLQAITDKRITIEIQLSGLPERRLRLQEQFVSTHTELEAAETELQTAREELSKEEARLAETETKLDEKKKLQTTLRTNAEFTAVRKEIASLEETKSACEERILQWMELVSGKEREVEQLRTAAQTVQQEYEQEIPGLDEKIEQLRQELQAIQQEFTTLAAHIGSALRNRFEGLVATRHGKAVVPIDDNTCGGCHGILPFAALEAIRLGQQIVTCDNCSRILYYPDHESA